MVSMATFKNESTFKNYSESGREGEFDRLFDEAVSEVKQKHMGKRHPLYINGDEEYAPEEITEYSPIDGSYIGKFQKATREQTDMAIMAASEAFKSWSQIDYKERVRIFRKAAELFSKYKFRVAAILSIENGKTRYESIGEVDEAIDFLNYYSLELEKNKGYVRRTKLDESKVHVKAAFQGAPGKAERVTIALKPYGVFGVIAPFNFPISISVGMSTGALITGNTVVFKPSSTDNMTMLTGLEIYNIFSEAGLPKGVFNYITGPGSEVGDELVMSKYVSGIVFTGSKSTGLSMISKTLQAGMQKAFIVEMGGKNPVIVSKNADLEAAASGIVSAAYGYCGQKCSAASRVYVHEAVKEELISKILDHMHSLKIGDPLKKENYVGPLISASALKRYNQSVEEIKKTGRIIYGGKVVSTQNGIYVEPVLAEADHSNPLFHKELFLPFLLVDTYKKLEEAIAKANDTEYGLTAGMYSMKKSEIREYSKAIQAGVVYINRETSATTGAIVGLHTFVGWKGSGLTGKGTGSRFYLQQFMREQSLSIVG